MVTNGDCFYHEAWLLTKCCLPPVDFLHRFAIESMQCLEYIVNVFIGSWSVDLWFIAFLFRTNDADAAGGGGALKSVSSILMEQSNDEYDCCIISQPNGRGSTTSNSNEMDASGVEVYSSAYPCHRVRQ